MSKSGIFENKAFQKTPPKVGGFNLVPQANSFNSIFDIKPLDELESNKIEKLLIDSHQPGVINENQIEKDVSQLKQITSEIRAIGRQGTVLMGERVYRAKEILKSYKDGTFSRWLESTFGTRKTGYNALSYFELYRALPKEDLKERFKKIPLRAAYVLASREGSLDAKLEIIRDHYEAGHSELVIIIQEKLPVALKDKRSKRNFANGLISQMRDTIKKLRIEKRSLTEKNKTAINDLFFEMKQLIDSISR